MLSLPSIATRVASIFLPRAFVPLNFFRVHKLAATIPSGNRSVVAAKRECGNRPQTVCTRSRPRLFLPLLVLSGEARRFGTLALVDKLRRAMKKKRAVAGGEPAPRCFEMAPKNIFSLARLFEKKPYAAFVSAQVLAG